MNPGRDDEYVVSPMGVTTLKQGDVIHHVLASGGGWGDPLDRDPSLVLEDVMEERLTVEYVRKEYGVVINEESMAVDEVATSTLRADRRAVSN